MKYTPDQIYSDYVYKSRWARWRDDLGRREHWKESVDRYLCHMFAKAKEAGWSLPKDLRKEITDTMYREEAVGSMRAFMSAGKALEKDEGAAYNCTGTVLNHPRAFDETCYWLMVGSGVGYTVERQHIASLPVIAEEFHDSDTVIHVRDSKIGWASALKQLISMLYAGEIPKWDTSKVRPAGARLKTFGGRASGPEPLEKMFRQISNVFKGAAGRRLNSVECLDIQCFIANAIIVGGVRRSASICLSNLTDDRMRMAKSGDWHTHNRQRSLCNISTAYDEMPSPERFLEEWTSLVVSKSGERGIFNKPAAVRQMTRNGMRQAKDALTNPCGEALFTPPVGLCNLSEVVVRPGITVEGVARRLKVATVLGVIQSLFTDFRYGRKVWKDTAEETRLLGVSLTGIMDDPFFAGRQGSRRKLEETLNQLRAHVRKTANETADKFGIPHPQATCLIKPSGTVSKRMGCGAGIHPEFYRQYIGNTLNSVNDPVTRFMIDQGVPHLRSPDDPDNTVIFRFPKTAPEGAVTAADVNTVEHLELIKTYRNYWCDGHNVSCTLNVHGKDWIRAADWVYNNWDDVCGLTFMDIDDSVFTYPPYQPVEDSTWNEIASQFPEELDWDKLAEYEQEDNTLGSQQRECAGPACALT